MNDIACGRGRCAAGQRVASDNMEWVHGKDGTETTPGIIKETRTEAAAKSCKGGHVF